MREEEKNRSSKNEEKSFNVQRLLRKRWAVPAVYLVAVAGVLSVVFFTQNNNESTSPQEGIEVLDPTQPNQQMTPDDEDAVEVAVNSERLKVPVANEDEVEIVGRFYDVDSSNEEQQEALVYYDNTYYQNKGIDYGHEEAFDVTAAFSGVVTKAEKDSILGYVVELSHNDQIDTYYHSLESIDVQAGDTLEQGDVIGQAGRNLYNTEAGVHVHFELRQDGVSINPTEHFEQPIDSILDVINDDEANEEVSEDSTDENEEDEEQQEEEELVETEEQDEDEEQEEVEQLQP